MALEAMDAGPIWQRLREHSDDSRPGWCRMDRQQNCPAYARARTELEDAGLLEPAIRNEASAHLAWLKREWA